MHYKHCSIQPSCLYVSNHVDGNWTFTIREQSTARPCQPHLSPRYRLNHISSLVLARQLESVKNTRPSRKDKAPFALLGRRFVLPAPAPRVQWPKKRDQPRPLRIAARYKSNVIRDRRSPSPHRARIAFCRSGPSYPTPLVYFDSIGIGFIGFFFARACVAGRCRLWHQRICLCSPYRPSHSWPRDDRRRLAVTLASCHLWKLAIRLRCLVECTATKRNNRDSKETASIDTYPGLLRWEYTKYETLFESTRCITPILLARALTRLPSDPDPRDCPACGGVGSGPSALLLLRYLRCCGCFQIQAFLAPTASVCRQASRRL